MATSSSHELELATPPCGVAAPPPAPAPTSNPLEGLGSCDPDEVEPLARQGQLTALQRGCMELSMGSADPDTRDRLSLALIANAAAQGDTASWADLIDRHLNEIDATNPTLAYRYALHRMEQGDPVAAFRLSEQALANRAQWTIDLYDAKTYAAHKLHAAAAQAWWRSVEAQREAGEADSADASKARERTGIAARAWHDFAVEASMDATMPAALCELADTDC